MDAGAASNASPRGPLEPVLLPGSVNLLAGSSGVGKTAFMAYLAKLLRAKAPVFGLQPERAPYIAYVGVDKSWRQSSSKWFNLEQLTDIAHYSLSDDKAFKKRRLRTKNDRTAIFQECLLKVSDNGKFPPGALVFFDPIALFLGGNLLDYDSSAVACMELREVCQELNYVSVLGAVHGGKVKADKKQGYARIQDHILGTAALYGYTDTQFYLASPEELKTKTALLHVSPHHSKPMNLALSREDDGRFCFAGAPQPVAATPASWVVNVLAEAPERTLEFAVLLKEAIDRECSHKKLQRLLNQEIDQGRIERVAHGRYRAVQPS